MGRSGVGGGSRGGGGRSGGGRSGGSRSSGRSAMGGSSSRSFSSGRSGAGSFGSSRGSMGGFGGGRGGAGGFGGGTGGFGPGPAPNRHQPGGPVGGRHPRRTGSLWPFLGGANIFINTGGSSAGQTVTSENKTKRKSGIMSTVLIIIVWLVLIYALFTMVGGSAQSGREPSGGNFTKSTVDRDKLHLNLSDEAGYYTDECDWIRNRTTLENGLKDFYDSTGILPYVYIIDNVAGDYDPSTEKLEQFAESRYEELFEDEGHALLVFWDYGGAYEYTLWLGEDAAELMDTEACDILFDYLDYYYYYADTEDEFFADAFADAGERMMSVTRSPMYYIVIVVVAGAVVFAVYKVWKSRQEKEAARKKRAEEILNSPLEKFGDNGDIIDELEKKYEKEI